MSQQDVRSQVCRVYESNLRLLRGQIQVFCPNRSKTKEGSMSDLKSVERVSPSRDEDLRVCGYLGLKFLEFKSKLSPATFSVREQLHFRIYRP